MIFRQAFQVFFVELDQVVSLMRHLDISVSVTAP